MSNFLAPFVRQQAFKLGVSSPGAVFSFFLSGTSTPQPVYNAAGTSLGTSLTADSTGRFVAFFLAPVAYRVKLVDSTGATVWQEDGITSGSGGSSADVTFVQSGSGAVTRTAQSKLRERYSVLDFGAVGDGVTDDTAAIQATIQAACNGVFTDTLMAQRGSTIWFPHGSYNITDPITIPSRGLMLQGDGTEGAIVNYTTADANIIYSPGSPNFGHGLTISNLVLNGNGIANIGVTLGRAEECTFDRAFLFDFADACIVANASSIMRLIDAHVSVAPTLMRLTDISAISIVGGNFFGTTTGKVFDIVGTVADISIVGTWIERFLTLLNVANAAGNVNLANFSAIGCRFISTVTNARMVRIVSTVNGNLCRAVPVSFRDCTVYMDPTTFNVLATLTGNTDGNSGLSLELQNVTFPIAPTTAIVSGDHASVRVIYEHITGVAAANYFNGTGSPLGIDAGGQFSYGTSMAVRGGQLAWPAVQHASSDANTLDDFEKGFWTDRNGTPIIGGEGGTSGQTYAGSFGSYVKVGPQVTCWFSCFLTAKGTITGNVVIGNLPFTSDAIGEFAIGTIRWGNLATNWVNVVIAVKANSTIAYLKGATAAGIGNNTNLLTADIDNSTQIVGTFSYLAAT